jgi:protein-tyrosine-phosphatase
MKRIVFVCSGNICRSPMAAGIARDRLETAGIDAVVISAGTLNINGQPASPHGVTACRELGIDIEGHRSQGISVPLLLKADAIVVMAPGHEQHLARLEPALAPKIERMWAYADPARGLTEIADPVGLELPAYRTCRDLLVECIDRWVAAL